MCTAPVSSYQQVKHESWFASGPAIVWHIAASVLLLHFLTANRYGHFGDEMYYMACGEHLDRNFHYGLRPHWQYTPARP